MVRLIEIASLLIVHSEGFSVTQCGNLHLRVSRGVSTPLEASRRDWLSAVVGGTLSVVVAASPSAARAAVTDETANYADLTDSSYSGFVDSIAPIQTTPQATVDTSDEVTFEVAKKDLTAKGLGIELGQVSFRTNTRIFVKSVLPDSLAERLGIEPNFVVVAINDQSVERTNAEGVGMYLSDAVKKTEEDGFIVLRFRNPAAFREKVSAGALQPGDTVTTQVAPGGDTTQRNPDGSVKRGRQVTEQVDQRLTVTQLIPPPMCNRGATTDDLLEISYLGTVVETGQVFDGSAVNINGKGIPGRGNDISLYFVLGKQPFGQFPPGWDVGLEGMCVVSKLHCLDWTCVMFS